MIQPVIGFAGMTHLGLVSGVSASEKGFKLVCFDPDAERIAALQRGELPVSEPQLDELVRKNADHLRFTADPADLKSCDVVYVAPDVATDDRGQSDLRTINALLDTVFEAARADAVIVVLSQVPPGYTRRKQREGRILYYQVETLIFGRAVERALYPERYIVGCADPGKPLPASFRTFLEAHGCPILPMRYESAELAKISINMCLAASVSTANTLAELCEKIGADWSEIVPALKLDKRIGQHAYLSPGLGISGGNLERDLSTLIALAGHYGNDAGVIKAFVANSLYSKNWPFRILKGTVLERMAVPTIGIWGLSYKENTHSTKNSPAIALIRQLMSCQLRVYDPVVPATAVSHPQVDFAATALEAAAGVDALAIMTPWPEFRQISCEKIAANMRGRLIIDPYRLLDPVAARMAGFEICTLGVAVTKHDQ